MKHKIQIAAERQFIRNSIDLHFFIKGDGATYAAMMQMTKLEEGRSIESPMVSLKLDEAQQLMDELWHVGIRPTEGTGSTGSLAASERHLKDMQTIVMHTLKINQKGTA